jgi:N6-L-threonylcarbamoyladenine synthase
MAGRPGFELSFSGLKTALAYRLRDLGGDGPAARADLAAGYQRAIVESLVERTFAALDASGRDTLAVVGGVAANGVLRAAFAVASEVRGVRLRLAPLALCADNAAMIAAAAQDVEPLHAPDFLALDAYARSPLAGWVHSPA